jgi:hypothetical protein
VEPGRRHHDEQRDDRELDEDHDRVGAALSRTPMISTPAPRAR